jgi:serine/threonine protein kinase
VLDRSVNEKRALPFAYLRHVCSDAASGLRFLHTSTIVHRDIKPANLLVFSLSSSETVVAKLTDFGSARVAKGNLMTANKAGIMQMASNDRSGLEGTPIYMAPELFAGSARPSEATDVHALGMTFYETTSFVEPYTEIAFPWDIAKAVVAGKRPEWPAERRVPDWFAALVRRLRAPDATRPRRAGRSAGARRAMQNRTDRDSRFRVILTDSTPTSGRRLRRRAWRWARRRTTSSTTRTSATAAC